MASIADRLEQTKGRSSGFDYLRIGLSVSVIGWHTILTCYGSETETPFLTGSLRPIVYFILPSFFALSGFLVAGSLFRNSIPAFLALRAIRIFPALCCEVVISALILGPLLTAFTLQEYFSDQKLWSYFLNVIGKIHYQLPGLFLTNPFPNNVNVQLWTIPYELECYIAITVLALLTVVRRPVLYAVALAGLTVALSAYGWKFGDAGMTNDGPSGRLCVLAFLAGVLVFVCKDRLPFNGIAAGIAAGLVWLTLMHAGTEYLSAFPVAYLTIWLGLQDPKKFFVIAGADYSYGMYLYGFPMQQAVSQLLPGYRYWYVNLFLSLIASGIAAYLSWNLVEKRVMKQKTTVTKFVDARFNAMGFLARPPSAF